LTLKRDELAVGKINIFFISIQKMAFIIVLKKRGISFLLKYYNIINAGFDSEAFAVGARKADITLVNKINEAFFELYSQGKFQEISNKWFGEDVATKEVKSK